MKKKSIALIALAMLMVLSLMNTAMAAEEDFTTSAYVAFEAGEVEFGEVELSKGINGMDLDFGTRKLPTGGVTYMAIDNHDINDSTGSHTLRILSAKPEVPNLTVNVSLTDFVTQDQVTNQSFEGVIKLVDGVADAALSPEASIEIPCGGAAQRVLTGSLPTTGVYDTTWSQTSITLTLAQAEALKINEPASYKATMTWTLDIT